MIKENSDLKAQLVMRFGMEYIIGHDHRMLRIFELPRKFSLAEPRLKRAHLRLIGGMWEVRPAFAKPRFPRAERDYNDG